MSQNFILLIGRKGGGGGGGGGGGCIPFHAGDFRVRSLLTFNQTLFGKCLWRYDVEREAFW
jgi:hypothetical protein